ncbi:MAG TPA: Hsp20/alpha crystallin family protein [Nitrospirales bacterium]|nr:Hsp20/alpha crystallin family protein [Nitrospirales bacterium]
MTLVSYEPWSFVNRLHRELNQAFNTSPNTAEVVHTPTTSWTPRVDIHEEAERFVVLADVPGVEAKDIDITAENGVLTIKGQRNSEHKAKDKNGYERIERTSGSFLRRFTLPESANTDSITAKQTNGVLEVSIPKQPKVQPRRICVEAA